VCHIAADCSIQAIHHTGTVTNRSTSIATGNTRTIGHFSSINTAMAGADHFFTTITNALANGSITIQ
jgi:hypothetical protein